ncbi:MAG TPA: HAMP domain-containing sensor histidine kinase [Bacillus sp. (in: firmicutes)]
MKMRSKINLITTAWILFVLIVVNTIVFFSFLRLTFNMEQGELVQKAQNILNEMKVDDSAGVIEEKLTHYLNNHSFIRIINSDSKIINQVTNDPYLATKMNTPFSKELVTKRSTIHQENGEKQIIMISVPIKANGQVVKTLVIGERLLGFELGKDLLFIILVICTILGVGLSLLGGKWLSNIIINPISNMINTMEDIEKSGIPKKISILHGTKDELQKMAETFNRMIDRLNENLEKQKQFVSDSSHELKTPLTVIKSYADLLRRRGVQNEELTRHAINSIYSEATRIQKMTERFLDLANTELENSLEIKTIDLISLCQNIVNQLREVYKREFVLHYQETPIIVNADELKLKQVIIILLDNAMKYSTEKIDIYLQNHKPYTILQVKDHGIGIPENELEHIFERFYRVDKARSRETGGTGLGLSIAKNIIKQHQGDIKVTSKDGVGTSVELFLP